MNTSKLLTIALLSGSAFLGFGYATIGYAQDKETISSAAASDTAITTKVKAALLTTKDINSLDITVNTSEGVVQLSGFVKSQWQADRAAQVVASIGGVRSVQNELVIKG